MDKVPLAVDVIDVVAAHLNLPKSFVRQIITALKAAGRIDSARPISPPVTPRAIARIVLALASPSIKDAVRVGKAIGELPIVMGDGQPSAEDELADMVEEAAGWRNGGTNFRDGRIVLSGSQAAIIGSSTFRTDARAKGLERLVVIDNSAVANVARDLLPNERKDVRNEEKRPGRRFR
jgi:hypothetical protein